MFKKVLFLYTSIESASLSTLSPVARILNFEGIIMEKLIELYKDINNILANTGCAIDSPMHQEVIWKSLCAKWDLAAINRIEKKPSLISVYQKKLAEAFDAGDIKEATKASVAISVLSLFSADVDFKQSKKSALDILDRHMQGEAFKHMFVSLGEAFVFTSALKDEIRNFGVMFPNTYSMGNQGSYGNLGPNGPFGARPTNFQNGPWGMSDNGPRFRPFNPGQPIPHSQHNLWGGRQTGSFFDQGTPTSVYPERNQPPQGFTARNVNPNFRLGRLPGLMLKAKSPILLHLLLKKSKQKTMAP